MKTVEEILRESGLTDEQIKALDAKALAGFTQVVSTASQTLEEAERVKRATSQTFENEISPALDAWANDKAALETKVAAYEAALKAAKDGGFQIPEILSHPAATPAAQPTAVRDTTGRFVAGANAVPGSPQFMTREDGFKAISTGQWYVTEYMRLHNGAPPPVDFETVASEAAQQRMPFRDYVERKYEYQAKRDKIRSDEQKKHDDSIRKEVEDRLNKEFAERTGNNPNLRQAQPSQFASVEKAVKEGTRKDPIGMTREQRRVQTRQAIQKDIADNASTVN